jgi:hypothetical protein
MEKYILSLKTIKKRLDNFINTFEDLKTDLLDEDST